MSGQESALLRVAAALDGRHTPYMVIGGLANVVWGEPRATLDIDVTVWVEEPELAEVVADLCALFHPLSADPLHFLRETRVLPLESVEGVRIDVVFGLLPFEREAIARAVAIEVAGSPVRFCTAEDLILMKIISHRSQDLADAEGVALRRMAELDLGYLEPRVRELAELLENPEITRRWSAWRANAAGRR